MRTIFVFGSNREGRHGAGAALDAMKRHGAIYGIPSGLQGNSYAIVTKELRKNHPPVSLEEVRHGVLDFAVFVRHNPHLHFHVTPIGCGLAGFTPAQIAPFFMWAYAEPNITLPEVFKVVLSNLRKQPA